MTDKTKALRNDIEQLFFLLLSDTYKVTGVEPTRKAMQRCVDKVEALISRKVSVAKEEARKDERERCIKIVDDMLCDISEYLRKGGAGGIGDVTMSHRIHLIEALKGDNNEPTQED